MNIDSLPSGDHDDALIAGHVALTKEQFREVAMSGVYVEGERSYATQDGFTLSAIYLAEARGLI